MQVSQHSTSQRWPRYGNDSSSRERLGAPQDYHLEEAKTGYPHFAKQVPQEDSEGQSLAMSVEIAYRADLQSCVNAMSAMIFRVGLLRATSVQNTRDTDLCSHKEATLVTPSTPILTGTGW